jgi:sugar O-acyltransferase (sialic acid O-acetyltransferase NeuD family)
MTKKLILIGGGGHAKSCIDVIEQTGAFEITGILDLPVKLNTQVLNYQVIGTDDDIIPFIEQDHWFLITIGQIKSAALREAYFDKLQTLNARLATVISPLAYVSKHAEIGAGSIIMHGARVNAGAIVGRNCIVNTNANIEHDTVVGDNTHISTGAVLNGDCRTGNGVFVGSGAVVQQGVQIASHVVIGAASLVHRNIMKEGIYAGNPFTRIA